LYNYLVMQQKLKEFRAKSFALTLDLFIYFKILRRRLEIATALKVSRNITFKYLAATAKIDA
jgi:hypothetical protein